MVTLKGTEMKKIAFIFPGQGSQYAGMGKSLYDNFKVSRDVFDSAEDILKWDIKGLCFDNKEDKINLTEYTQPAILVTSFAAWKVLAEEGISPEVVAGHSLGEYSAILSAGGAAFPVILPAVQSRGRYMQEAVPKDKGMMAAVLGLSKEEVAEVCDTASFYGIVSPANYNTFDQIVIAGSVDAVTKAMELAKEKGAKKIVPLNVSVPSHTQLMKASSERFSDVLDGMKFSDLDVPLITNVDAKLVTLLSDIKGSLIRQLTNPVRWAESMSTLINLGFNTFIEVGPGRILSGLMRKIARDMGVKTDIMNIEDADSFKKTVEAVRA